MTVNLSKPHQSSDVPPLSRGERWLVGIVGVAAVAVGGLGLASSFDAVTQAAARWGFSEPWMVPVGIDIAIPVFTVTNLLLIRMNMPLGWVRAVPWALTAVTCWLNIAAGHTLSAKIAHGVMPLLWVVLSEIAAHAYAVRIGAATGRRMDGVRRSRWFLDPFGTATLKRRMILWEITSYPEALKRERERQLARADLRERYGRRWRRKAPHRTRVLLRLGEYAPADTESADDTGTVDDRPAPLVICGAELGTLTPPKPRAKKPSPKPAPRRGKGGKAKPQSKRSQSELIDQAREVTATWSAEQLTAEALRTALRCSPVHARAARDTLRAERSRELVGAVAA